MPVLTREALESSSLADLHALASELKLDGFRRLRKADLVDAIIERQGGEPAGGGDDDAGDDAPKPRRRSRGGRGRGRKAEEDGATDEDAGADVDTDADSDSDTDTDTDTDSDEDEAPAPRRRRGRSAARDADTGDDTSGSDDDAPARGGRGRGRDADEEERIAEGVVELLGNGSGFVRVNPPDPSEDDVYVSAAQVRRCELVSGDKVTGPVRRPRRSERYPSLVRIDTINGSPADEVAEGTPYDDQPAAFPSERFALGSEDPTLKAIEWLTPIGRGSRAVLVGGPGAGKTEALRLLAGALTAQEDLQVSIVLAGVRPEEIHVWKDGPGEIAGAMSFAASADALGQLVERAVETAKRIASRGGHAVVLIDGIDALAPQAARRALAAARAFVDGGSLTIVATAAAALGGETTVIALDPALTLTRRFPALDLTASATVRPDLLVGEAGAEAIAQARAQALGVA